MTLSLPVLKRIDRGFQSSNQNAFLSPSHVLNSVYCISSYFFDAERLLLYFEIAILYKKCFHFSQLFKQLHPFKVHTVLGNGLHQGF